MARWPPPRFRWRAQLPILRLIGSTHRGCRPPVPPRCCSPACRSDCRGSTGGSPGSMTCSVWFGPAWAQPRSSAWRWPGRASAQATLRFLSCMDWLCSHCWAHLASVIGYGAIEGVVHTLDIPRKLQPPLWSARPKISTCSCAPWLGTSGSYCRSRACLQWAHARPADGSTTRHFSVPLMTRRPCWTGWPPKADCPARWLWSLPTLPANRWLPWSSRRRSTACASAAHRVRQRWTQRARLTARGTWNCGRWRSRTCSIAPRCRSIAKAWQG
jgi:hypothetical protein